MAAKPECVLLLNFGADRVNFHKQAHNFGLTKIAKIAAAAGGGQTDFRTIGTKILAGSYEGANYYHTIENPVNKKVISDFRKRYGVWMPYISANAYSQTKMILTGVKRAGTTDLNKVIPAIEDYEYDGLTGREIYRKCDHQCFKTYFTLRLKEESDKKDPEDYAEIIGGSKNYLPCEKTKCVM
jgi:branched-chain amino acid transport system substrate-binding protein